MFVGATIGYVISNSKIVNTALTSLQKLIESTTQKTLSIAKEEKENNSLLKSTQKKPFNFRVMTVNVCTPPEVRGDDKLYAKFSWPSRQERIFKQIVDESPDLIGFQEIRNEKDNFAVADLWTGLAKHGYELISFRNNPSDLSPINVIAYKTSKFAVDNTHRWWASKTPDQFSDSWGNGWGRITLMATLYPVTTIDIRGQKIPSPDYAREPIHFVNLHNGLKHEEKINSNRVLIEQIQRIIDQKKVGGVVVIVGDFNSFSDDGTDIQELAVITEVGYREALELRTFNGIPLSGTFIGYSYDKFRPKQGKLAGRLDHVFIKSFSENISYSTSSYLNLKKYNNKPESLAKTEAELLTDENGLDTRDDFCSDHAAGIVDIQLIPKNK